ncbi:MAG: glutamate--tRNA ligase [Nitrospirae bacterium]|nr:glutamate--tRNA ligase [Nitrospirota bacterium]
MSNNVRVRFAPSPTGHLHLGGARTALFNWLFARHHGGKFILRIEDTDRSRSTDEYIEAIIEGMKWLGLDWDEGPFRQTDRFDIYKGYIDRLLNEGRAYYCYCSPEELEQRRQDAIAQKKTIKYDGRCRNLKGARSGAPAAVRFKMPNEGQAIVNDIIKGQIEFDNSQLEDLIIMRSDGTPTYNFVVVADDIDMNITHVIRGDDHLNNTPKQIFIYRAFDREPPHFAHLPMILGNDKTRLSKRHGAASIMAYREAGYLPDALVNYLARLGWAHGDQEVFTREELIQHFSLESVGASAAVFNSEKLLWLNSQYIMKEDPKRLAEIVLPFLISEGIIHSADQLDINMLSKAVSTLQERSRTILELAKSLRYYIADNIEIEPAAAAKFLKEGDIKLLLELSQLLSELTEFREASIKDAFSAIVERHGIKLGALAQPVRVALTGGTASPGVFEMMEIIGRERVLNRLSKAINPKND